MRLKSTSRHLTMVKLVGKGFGRSRDERSLKYPISSSKRFPFSLWFLRYSQHTRDIINYFLTASNQYNNQPNINLYQSSRQYHRKDVVQDCQERFSKNPSLNSPAKFPCQMRHNGLSSWGLLLRGLPSRCCT